MCIQGSDMSRSSRAYRVGWGGGGSGRGICTLQARLEYFVTYHSLDGSDDATACV